MTPKVRKKPISLFVRNILIMLRGSVLAQITTAIGGLYLAKLFGPENYGVYGSVISIASIVALVFTLQLDKAIVLSKGISSKKNWISFLLPFVLIVSSLLASYFFFLEVSIHNFSYEFIFFSIIISCLLAIYIIYEALLTSNKNFKVLGNAKIVVSICIVLFQFIFFKSDISNGLIIGFLLAQVVIVLCFIFSNLKFLGKLSFSILKNGLNQHKDILYFLFPSNIINGIGVHIMPILILAFFDAKIAAVYFLSLKLLSMPLHLMTSSIGNVFFERASNTESKQSLYITTKKVVIVNLSIMFIFLIFINTIGVLLLNYFFDEKWEHLSVFLLILSFLFLARASFNPISSLIIVKKKNHIGLIFNIYLVFVNLMAIWLGYKNNNILYTLYILSFFGGVGYFALLYYFGKILKNDA